MTNNSETIETLRKARALIEKGWTRNHYHRGGRYCAAGAVAASAADRYDLRIDAEHVLNKAVRRADGGHLGVVSFNDAQPSKKPVLALFDATIAELEAGEVSV